VFGILDPVDRVGFLSQTNAYPVAEQRIVLYEKYSHERVSAGSGAR